MNAKQIVYFVEGLLLFGSAATVAVWGLWDGIPEFLFFSVAFCIFGYFMIRRSRKN